MLAFMQIEKYFIKNGFPAYDVTISPGATVTAANAKRFVESSCSTLRTHKGNFNYLPYFLHLNNYYQIVLKQNGLKEGKIERKQKKTYKDPTNQTSVKNE